MKFDQAKNSAPIVLVEFYASWCPHCQHMMPVVAKLKEQVAGKAAVVQYDIDKDKADAQEANVDTIPTFILFKNGAEVWRHSGEIKGEDLLAQIKAQE